MSVLMEAIDKYLKANNAMGTLSPSSQANRRYELRRFATYCHRHRIYDPQKINRTVIREYFSSLTVSNRTKRTLMAIHTAFFNFCVDESLVLENPLESIKTPRTFAPEPDLLSEDELRRFFQAVVDISRPSTVDRNLALMGFLSVLCLRVSETVSLRLTDLDLPDNPDGNDYGSVRLHRKGGREVQLPLSSDLYDLLKRWIEQLPPDSQWLFPSQKGHLSRKRVHTLIARALRHADIVKRTMGPHLLRHTGASRYIAKGMDIRTVQHLLGHASLVTTSRYVHLVGNRESLRKAIAHNTVFRSKQTQEHAEK